MSRPTLLDYISEATLRNFVGATIFDRGKAYYRQKRVTIYSASMFQAECVVEGSEEYYVKISAQRNGLGYNCDCPYGGVCKHVIASALAVRDFLTESKSPDWRDSLREWAQAPVTQQRTGYNRKFLLVLAMQKNTYYANSWSLTAYRIYMSHVPETDRGLEWANPAVLGEYLEKNKTVSEHAEVCYSFSEYAGCVNLNPKDTLVIAAMLAQKGYGSMSDSLWNIMWDIPIPIFAGSERKPIKTALTLLPEAGRVSLAFNREDTGVRLTPVAQVGGQVIPLDPKKDGLVNTSPLIFMADQYLFRVEKPQSAQLIEKMLEEGNLLIPPEDEQEFVGSFMPALLPKVDVSGDAIQVNEYGGAPVPRLYLSDEEGKLFAQLRFGYGGVEAFYDAGYPAETTAQVPGSWNLMRVTRQPEVEQAAWEKLSGTEFGLKRESNYLQPGLFSLRAKIHPVDFLMRYVPRLTAAGYEIFGEEKLKLAKVNRNKPTISFNISSGIDWFDVKTNINYGDLEVSLKDMRKAIKKGDKFIKLADGSIGEIPEEWLERYKHLFNLAEETGDGLRVGAHHLTLLDQLFGESERVKSDDEYKRRSQQLRNFGGIKPVDLPSNINVEMRPYQKSGYDWMHFLNEYGFGGCLADDMGLGKTVQVLVFLQSLRAEAKAADLIVLPRSLLVNWQREAAKFTPGLKILEYFGNLREKDTSIFNDYDLVITTYGVMLRDIDMLRKYRFHYAVLDESQAIKNPVAQSAKAARLLNAERRLVMTGTPVENSTGELWSQFAFLNPGLLGNVEYFKENFANPIERRGDDDAAQFLRKMVYPFILRRTKDQVAPELPPRTERVIYTDLEPAQRKFYNHTRDYYRGMLLGMIEEGGIDDARMKVLEGLLRLRQISNHPRLVDPEARGDSGKFELLLETLETLQAEGHKALVFSQFVQMLSLVRAALDERKITYTYLDGSTRDRHAEVDKFQSDPSIPFFLLSLKAGGVGLNLTAADYVIHIDPWWNPAVEMQATDRSHRIGQDKPVFVYKLISRDTVEEKILLLQERKRELVQQLITTEGSFFKSLTKDDVKVLFS